LDGTTRLRAELGIGPGSEVSGDDLVERELDVTAGLDVIDRRGEDVTR
jgi:hypothetical protein